MLKEQRMASSQKIRKGPKCRCFTFIKGQLRQLFIFRIEPTCIIDTLQKAVGNFDCSQGFGKEPIPKRIFSTNLNCSEKRLFGSLKVI